MRKYFLYLLLPRRESVTYMGISGKSVWELQFSNFILCLCCVKFWCKSLRLTYATRMRANYLYAWDTRTQMNSIKSKLKSYKRLFSISIFFAESKHTNTMMVRKNSKINLKNGNMLLQNRQGTYLAIKILLFYLLNTAFMRNKKKRNRKWHLVRCHNQVI